MQESNTMLPKKRILITGKNSYIGNHLRIYLEANTEHKVTAISVRDDQWKQMDFSQFDSIVHVAGIVHQKEKAGMADLYKEVNSILPYEIAKKAKKEGCSQFVFLSSMSVYGIEEGRITKNTLPNPKTYYGKSKLLAERKLLPLQSATFHISVVRPPMIYGEGCKGNYVRLKKLAKITKVFPKYVNQRSMLSIENCSQYLTKIIEQEKRGIFFPQDLQYHSTAELVVTLGRQQGKNIWLVPGFQWFILLLKKRKGRIGTLMRKLFGDCTYE